MGVPSGLAPGGWGGIGLVRLTGVVASGGVQRPDGVNNCRPSGVVRRLVIRVREDKLGYALMTLGMTSGASAVLMDSLDHPRVGYLGVTLGVGRKGSPEPDPYRKPGWGQMVPGIPGPGGGSGVGVLRDGTSYRNMWPGVAVSRENGPTLLWG